LYRLSLRKTEWRPDILVKRVARDMLIFERNGIFFIFLELHYDYKNDIL